MADNQGMFAALEAEGRRGDTEIGSVDTGSLVLPVLFTQDEQFNSLRKSLSKLFKEAKLDLASFTVTPENTDYSINDKTATQAHLTNGEIVIPAKILNVSDKLFNNFKELFAAADTDINQYIVGNEANSINPETGLPEFWGFGGFFSSIVDTVSDVVGSVADAVGDVAGAILDPVESFVSKIGDITEDVVKNPYVAAVASFVYPAAAPYINAANTLANGKDLSFTQLASLGISSAADFGNLKVDPSVAKAIKTSATIADGGNPVAVLAQQYGSDFAKELELDKAVQTSIKDVFGEDVYAFVNNRMDINQAAADLVAGENASRILSNQFGDELAGYLSSGDTQKQALGFAGIEAAVSLDEGKTAPEALLAGGKTFYDKGGKLPDLNAIAGSVGLDLGKIDLNINDFIGNFDIKLPDLLGDYKLPELASLGIDLGKIDLGDIDYFKDLYDEYSLGDLKDLGIDIPSLGGELPALALTLSTEQQQQAADYQPSEELDILTNTVEDNIVNDGIPLSRALLSRTFA